jgi:DNA-directed RNA polymerase specialized sigma24 family protein
MLLGADPDTAEDVVQMAFTRAFPVWRTIRFPQACVRKAAQNEYFMHCRTAARETSLDAAPGRADRPAGISVALALEQQQAHTRQFLAGGIAGLPPKQRQVMAWTWDGFSDAEIAEQLGDSEAAARSLVAGLDELREVVDKLYPDLDAELVRQRHERAKGLRFDERAADINYLNGGPPARGLERPA